MNLVKDRALNNVYSADITYRVLEKSLKADALELLLQVEDMYRTQGDIHFDLTSFIENRTGTDIYIIDRNNTIIATTDSVDLGLDFNPYTIVEDYDFVDSIRLYAEEGISYLKDDASVSLNPKYSYYFNQAMATMEPVQIPGEYNGREAIYWYITYRIIPMTKDEAIMQLIANKGKQFDETIVDVFVLWLRAQPEHI